MADPPGDAELVARLLHGDEPAFRALYERHADAVYNVALRVLGGAARAADVTQEVFLLLHQRAALLQRPERLRAWLLRTATNLSIDWWRRHEPQSLERTADQPPADSPSPLDQLLQREEQARLAQAILELSPPLRGVVVLRYVEGASYVEIAELLQLPIGTVKSRIYRAHEALVARLGSG